MQVTLVTQRKPYPYLIVDVLAAVREELHSAGCEVAEIQDGDPSIAEAEALLFFADAAHFPRSAEMLASVSSPPPAVLWQLEPLPPRAEEIESVPLRSALLAFADTRVATALRKVTPLAVKRALQRPVAAGIEQRASERRNSALKWIREAGESGWLRHAFASTPERVATTRDVGLPATYEPLGYSPLFGRPLGLERDLDVVFLGHGARRRHEILDRLKAGLASRAITLTTVEGGCFGEERARLFNRTKVAPVIFNYDWEIPRVRFLLSMACGALVVCESGPPSEPFVDGKHFVSAAPDEMAEKVAYYVENDKERTAIAAEAWNFISNDLTLAAAVRSIITTLKGLV